MRRDPGHLPSGPRYARQLSEDTPSLASPPPSLAAQVAAIEAERDALRELASGILVTLHLVQGQFEDPGTRAFLASLLPDWKARYAASVTDSRFDLLAQADAFEGL